MIKRRKKLSDKQKLRDFFSRAASELRSAAPPCRHFGDCGGCEFQDIAYNDQLRLKQDAFVFVAETVVAELLDKAESAASDEPEGDAGRAALQVHAENLKNAVLGRVPSIVASPSPLGYRQRMDYVFAFGKAGLRRVNRHRQVVELEECPLLGPAPFAVFQEAKRLAENAGLESYDYLRHTGELRYFVVRRSRNGQILLSLVTKSDRQEREVDEVLGKLVADGQILSGHRLLAPGLGDVSFGERRGGVGAPWIVETMNGVDLRIGPNTFFQSNPAVAEKAYAAIRDFCPEGGLALDMYSGVGSIALSVAGKAGRVLAAENVPENVELATINIAEAGVDNVVLVEADASTYLDDLALTPGAPRIDLAVVNPPRPGVGEKGMTAIRRLSPERLAYLSCNPFTLLRDLAPMLGLYALRVLTVYDMFPQTRHFETLALLEKISP